MDNQENVWIDRKEYERLKSLESNNLATTYTKSQSNIFASPYVDTSQEHQNKFKIDYLAILLGISAIATFFFPAAMILFLLIGAYTAFRYVYDQTKSIGNSIVIGIALLACLYFGLQFIFISIFFLGCWTGLGSCRSV